MAIPPELLAELGVPAAVVVVGLSIYFLEIRRSKTGIKIDKDPSSELKLWMISHIKDPIMKAIRDE